MRFRSKKTTLKHSLKTLTASPNKSQSRGKALAENLEPLTTEINFEERKYKDRYLKSVFLTPKNITESNKRLKKKLRRSRDLNFQTDIMAKINNKKRNFRITKSNSFYDPIGSGFYSNPWKIEKEFLKKFKEEYSKNNRFKGMNLDGIKPDESETSNRGNRGLNSYKLKKMLQRNRKTRSLSKKENEIIEETSVKKMSKRRGNHRVSISIAHSIESFEKKKENRIAYRRNRVQEAKMELENDQCERMRNNLWMQRKKIQEKIGDRLPVFKYKDYKTLANAKCHKSEKKKKKKMRTIDMLNREDIRALLRDFKRKKKSFTSFDLEKFLVETGVIKVIKDSLKKKHSIVYIENKDR